jgi:ParB/RepB/Spo0J family partition protein
MHRDDYDLDHADPASVRVNPNNVRTRRDPEEDRRLVESVARIGVLQPPGVLPDNLVAWGNRRVWAAVEAKLKAIPVIRLKKPLSETEFLVHQLAENEVRADLGDPEVYLAVSEVRRLNPKLTNAELAAVVHKDPSMLTRIFAVDRLIPAAREAFLGGAFGFSIAYEIAKGKTEPDQHQRLLDRQGGSSRADMARSARSARPARRPAAADTVKTGSLRVALGGGVTVTVRGPGLTLARAAELLDRAGKEVDKAHAQNLNVRTAERVWRDRAAPKADAEVAQ